ncbi:carboxypeptidase-like regulatory domain-containing protein [Desulfonatronum thiodismutans]|uniref:carboxypeptidase-like regulatory domain-containing protein n=1 Tax=Desulfonatronum thiodismutans TaxID=159290 RepID=UPI0004ABEB2A
MICYRITLVSIVLLVMAFLPVTPFAQLQAGNLYGTVLFEEDPLPLPGVMITLQGQGAPQVQITNDQGHFRFLDLPAGVYSLVARLEGFSTIQYANIVINIGRNTQIEILMGQSR